jgi:hypothetical protein
MFRTIDGVMLSLTIVLSIGCLNAHAQMGKVVFKDPGPSRPDATLWRLTHDPVVRDYANYHNTQCWSPDGRYISINRWADRTKKSGAEIRLYDLHKDEDTLIGLGIYPRWANRHNWLFYSQYTGKGESYEEGIANQWLDVDTGKTVTIGNGIEFLGETDSQDRWLYGNQRFRGDKPEFIAMRMAIKENSKPVVLGNGTGKRPLPSRNHPVLMMRNKKTDGGAPFSPSRTWSDLDGENMRTATALVQAGHQSWLGNGEYHLVGNQQVAGRKWNEPFPSNLHRLANCHFSDISPCGFSGRWACTNGRVADLRSGGSWTFSKARSQICFPEDIGDASEPYDPDHKGSPDGTKICFTSNYDIEKGHVSHMAASASKTETGKLEVTSTKGFPDSGAITYSREVIGYKSKTETSFVGLTRGKYGTKTLPIKAGGMLTSLDARLLRADNRDPAKLPAYMTRSFDEKNGPLVWQYQTDIYVAIVREPDAPYLRFHNGDVQLIPGENHWETFGYRIFKNGRPLTEEPVRPGADVNLPDDGIYTAIAVEWSGLESKSSLPLKVDKAVKLAVLKDKPENFSWTSDVWKVDRTAVTEKKALAAPKAILETIHLQDGVIALEAYNKGTLASRDDLDHEGTARRKQYYKAGALAKREYFADEGIISSELFDAQGWKTEETLWRYNNGKRTLSQQWWYEEGTPVKKLFSGGKTFVKDGKNWVQKSAAASE